MYAPTHSMPSTHSGQVNLNFYLKYFAQIKKLSSSSFLQIRPTYCGSGTHFTYMGLNSRCNSRPGLLVIHESGHILGLADAPGHADVDGPVHEVVVDDHLEHRDVVVGQVLDAHVLVLLQRWAVVGLQVLLSKEWIYQL